VKKETEFLMYSRQGDVMPYSISNTKVSKKLNNEIRSFRKEMLENSRQEILDFECRMRKRRNRKLKKKNKFCKEHLKIADAKKDVLLKFVFKDRIGRLKKWANSGNYKIDYKYYNLRAEKHKINSDLCEVCGKEKAYCMHHIFPLCKGGNNKDSNLIAVCETCHKKIHPFMNKGE